MGFLLTLTRRTNRNHTCHDLAPRIQHAVSIQHEEGTLSSSPKSNKLVKVFRRQALHISILLCNLLPQATGNPKNNGSFFHLTRRLEQFALEENSASNLVLVRILVHRPDVQRLVDGNTKKSQRNVQLLSWRGAHLHRLFVQA